MTKLLQSFWDGLVGWLTDLFNWILSLPGRLIGWVWDGVIWWFKECLQAAYDSFLTFVELAGSWFGFDYVIDRAYLADLYGQINVIFPLDEALDVLKFLLLTWWLVILYRTFGRFMFRFIAGFFRRSLLSPE